MAGSSTAQIRHLRVHPTQASKVTPIRRKAKRSQKSAQASTRSRSSRRSTAIMRTANSGRAQLLRYEKYSKYWSLLANFAAVVSVTGALFALMRKRRFW